ncbi:MAG: hypothetical protein V4561_06645 [Bacteroidota bacterium]
MLKHQNAEARHRRYFLMFRSAALKKWPSQHSYRCVLDGSPIGHQSAFSAGRPHRCHPDEGRSYTGCILIHTLTSLRGTKQSVIATKDKPNVYPTLFSF